VAGSAARSVADLLKDFDGTPLPRTVSARPPVAVSMRSPSMCTSREAARRGGGAGGILQAAELVEEPAGKDGAVDTVHRNAGRRVERFDDHAT
jgi:hypothetical protein